MPCASTLQSAEVLADPKFGIHLLLTVSLMQTVTLFRLPPPVRQYAAIPAAADQSTMLPNVRELLARRRFGKNFRRLFARYCNVIAPTTWGEATATPSAAAPPAKL